MELQNLPRHHYLQPHCINSQFVDQTKTSSPTQPKCLQLLGCPKRNTRGGFETNESGETSLNWDSAYRSNLA
ncbi:unnamed protein product [Cylicocyclus nassatus]|uniref:Uncharacterized protein n=1 Tax=Cylicocyclus nassatus TaxID=53992 RepID=A0AA36HA75_CYLNA|nr:unnamed protein product [Cylicocyclus nassatus]